ncbi:hypothetical protein V8E55_003352 [Tylopilus felleus]
MPYAVCETSNATVVFICCAQLHIPLTMGTTTATIVPQSISPPIPTGIPSTTCKWAANNSTGISEVESWLSCANQYENSTINSVCMWPVTMQSNVAHSTRIEGPAKGFGMIVLAGVVVRMVFAV